MRVQGVRDDIKQAPDFGLKGELFLAHRASLLFGRLSGKFPRADMCGQGERRKTACVFPAGGRSLAEYCECSEKVDSKRFR
jgi:hypothetical protein